MEWQPYWYTDLARYYGGTLYLGNLSLVWFGLFSYKGQQNWWPVISVGHLIWTCFSDICQLSPFTMLLLSTCSMYFSASVKHIQAWVMTVYAAAQRSKHVAWLSASWIIPCDNCFTPCIPQQICTEINGHKHLSKSWIRITILSTSLLLVSVR